MGEVLSGKRDLFLLAVEKLMVLRILGPHLEPLGRILPRDFRMMFDGF